MFGGLNVLHRLLPNSLFLTSQVGQKTVQQIERLEELVEPKCATCSNAIKLVCIQVIFSQLYPNQAAFLQ